jgi:hypothetical protein
MPPDVTATAVQKPLGPLEFLARRLQGYCWDVVGVAVPPRQTFLTMLCVPQARRVSLYAGEKRF